MQPRVGVRRPVDLLQAHVEPQVGLRGIESQPPLIRVVGEDAAGEPERTLPEECAAADVAGLHDEVLQSHAPTLAGTGDRPCGGRVAQLTANRPDNAMTWAGT